MSSCPHFLCHPCLVVGRVQVQWTQKGYVSWHRFPSGRVGFNENSLSVDPAFFGHEHPWGRRWHEGAYSLKQRVILCQKFRSSSLVAVSASKASLGFPTRSQLHRRIYHLPRRRKYHSTTFEAKTLHSPLKWEMLGLNVASASVASSNF